MSRWMSIFSLGPRPHLCIHVVGLAPACRCLDTSTAQHWLRKAVLEMELYTRLQHSALPAPQPGLVTHLLHISTSAGVPDPGWRHVTNGGSPREKITITDTLPLPLPLLYPLIIRLCRKGGKGVKIQNSNACKRWRFIEPGKHNAFMLS